jgi:hypothetical protein
LLKCTTTTFWYVKKTSLSPGHSICTLFSEYRISPCCFGCALHIPYLAEKIEDGYHGKSRKAGGTQYTHPSDFEIVRTVGWWCRFLEMWFSIIDVLKSR